VAACSKKQERTDPTRAGQVDENAASALDGGDGGDDLQRLDLRSSASASCPAQSGSSVDAASDCSAQGEERPDRCRKPARTRGRGARDLGSLNAAEENRMIRTQTAWSCRLPTERRRAPSEALYELFRDWQRTHTQSSVTALQSPRRLVAAARTAHP
jgi:hypothetical protein